MADTRDLKSLAERRAGSSPARGTLGHGPMGMELNDGIRGAHHLPWLLRMMITAKQIMPKAMGRSPEKAAMTTKQRTSLRHPGDTAFG